MSKLPNFRRIYKTDYPQDQQDLVDKLAVTINNGFELLYDALNNKLTLADNLAVSVKDITVTVDASGVPTKNLSFNVTFPGKVSTIEVGRTTNLTNSSALLTGGVSLLFTQSNSTVNIQQITGLQPNQKYQIRVVAWQE